MKQMTLAITYLLLCMSPCFAQKKNSTFVPGDVTLFEDNFRSDSVGAFPGQWWIMDSDSARYKSLCSVRYVNGKKALVIDSFSKRWLKYSLLSEPGPRMRSSSYLPNRFTLEYDFLMGSGMYLNFYATHAASIFIVSVLDNKHHRFRYTHAQYVIMEGPDDPPMVDVNVEPFNYREWHHLALSYSARRATVYLDGKMIFTTPSVDRDPLKFLLGYDSHTMVAYTNFRLATDSSTAEANFNPLLTENTFITHAILFETDKATIQPKSHVFLKRLAIWLKANPTIKLQINGHTDNNGEAAHNRKLSQARAEAVKAMLVTYGIDALRLTAKGWGATKPIQPNATPEGKAENRRVEFIRQ